MTRDELIAVCRAALADRTALGLAGPPCVMLHVRGGWPKSGRKRLAGRGSPAGEVVSDAERPGSCLVRFDAAEVLAWAQKAGA
jgi:hypothetical protein